MEIVPYFMEKEGGERVVIGEARMKPTEYNGIPGFDGVVNYFHEALNEHLGTTYIHNFFGNVGFTSQYNDHLDHIWSTEAYIRKTLESYKEQQ